MASFKDSAGREWRISLSVGQLKTIREQAGINIGLMLGDADKFAEILFAEPETIGKLLWIVCQDQASKMSCSIDEDSFLAAIDGPTIERATEALLHAVIDFFPRSKIGAALKGKLPAVFAEMDKNILSKMEQPSPTPTSTSKPSAGVSREYAE